LSDMYFSCKGKKHDEMPSLFLKGLCSCALCEIEIKMALLKYFAPSKVFNMRVRISKHIARLWVLLHLTVLSSKIKG